MRLKAITSVSIVESKQDGSSLATHANHFEAFSAVGVHDHDPQRTHETLEYGKYSSQPWFPQIKGLTYPTEMIISLLKSISFDYDGQATHV